MGFWYEAYLEVSVNVANALHVFLWLDLHRGI